MMMTTDDTAAIEQRVANVELELREARRRLNGLGDRQRRSRWVRGVDVALVCIVTMFVVGRSWHVGADAPQSLTVRAPFRVFQKDVLVAEVKDDGARRGLFTYDAKGNLIFAVSVRGDSTSIAVLKGGAPEPRREDIKAVLTSGADGKNGTLALAEESGKNFAVLDKDDGLQLQSDDKVLVALRRNQFGGLLRIFTRKTGDLAVEAGVLEVGKGFVQVQPTGGDQPTPLPQIIKGYAGASGGR
jgi:hypothetical protein